ncbi:MAG TPA: hypothetical protein VFJ22_01830 [Dermatophilaceae bacterium]|jgi:hypothetical protein|nr:hypothetical protein [Dermatophilaceae bacterium]
MSNAPARSAPGWKSPTLIKELLEARQTVDVIASIGLALRDDRRRRSLSQRAYAAARGWPRSRVVRLESCPGEVRLCDIVEALEDTGYGLFLGFADSSDHPVDDTPQEVVASPHEATGVHEKTAVPRPPTHLGKARSAITPASTSSPIPPNKEGRAVGADHWPASDLIARTGAGRRFPAHRVTVRISGAPLWWLKNRSTDARSRPPLWSAADDG